MKALGLYLPAPPVQYFQGQGIPRFFTIQYLYYQRAFGRLFTSEKKKVTYNNNNKVERDFAYLPQYKK